MGELAADQKERIKKRAGEMTKLLFDTNIENLQNIADEKKNQSISAETVEAALKFCFMAIETIKQNFNKSDSESIIERLNSLTFGELVSIYARMGEAQKAGKTLEEFMEDLFGDVETQTEECKALDVLRSITPKKSVIINSKLAQNITKNFIGRGEIEIDVGTAKKPARVVASMAYDSPAISLYGSQPFTGYDRVAHNGVCSIYQAGNKYFTPAMVYRAMNGITDSRYVSPQAVGAVTKSIEKQRATWLYINCEEQAKLYPDIKQTTLDDALLSVRKVTVVNQNGKVIEAYAFNTVPILYQYSKDIKQVLMVPSLLLNSGGAINTTEENMVLREYLVRRIEGMKGKNSLRSNRIAFSSIYDELDIRIDDLAGTKKRDTGARIRKNTGVLLEHLKSNGYIKTAAEYKDGRTIAGVEIIL